MESIRGEWPLLVFTTCAPLCTGGLLVVSVLALCGAFPHAEQMAAGPFAIVLWAIIAIGLCFSTLHLGKPLAALRAFARIGNSNVSNEVFTGTLFVVFEGLFLLVENSVPLPEEVLRALLILAAAFAVLFLLFQCLAYRMRTVVTWNSLSFSVEFAIVALLGGVCLCGLCAVALGAVPEPVRQCLVIFQVACCILLVFDVFAQGAVVSKSPAARRNPDGVLQTWSLLGALRVLLVVAGSVLWGFGMMGTSGSMASVALGTVLVGIAVVIGRVSFYRFYSNVGLARL